jgi:hypothetical protein
MHAQEFCDEVVLPAVMEQLDQLFPEFGWRRDSRGWVATNRAHTKAVLGARANRVVAHEPFGFLAIGGESMLWTSYLNGGTKPEGADFVRIVKELATRAGVDTSPIERQALPDRRAELRETFFELSRRELASDRGANARAYLDQRGFPLEAIGDSRLGVVPPPATTRRALADSGYSEAEVEAAGILADTRWPGRLCGAWRNEWGRIGTFWARALGDQETAQPRYLYLRGATRRNLPPYGFTRHTRELVLVEGFLDYHQLTARGVDNVAALGGTSTSTQLFERLSRWGVKTVVLCLDNDDAGRKDTARAVERAVRASASPAIYVVDSNGVAAKDPDALVRAQGIDAWRELLEHRECGIVWRAKEMVRGVAPDAAHPLRRATLRRVGAWMRSLPPRLALEQEDAVQVVAERCGYSRAAAQRAVEAWFPQDAMPAPDQSPGHLDRRVEAGVEL